LLNQARQDWLPSCRIDQDPQMPSSKISNYTDLNPELYPTSIPNKAAYWPSKKSFAVSDPIVNVRNEFPKIIEIMIGRKSAMGSLLRRVLFWT
jgi:hypothetical protein